MKGKVFISGGGGAKDSFLLDKEFVASFTNNKLLYIPIGLKRNIIGYDNCYKWIIDTLSIHTKESLDIEMWVDVKNKGGEDISNFEGIYIGGASNTYEFLNLLYESSLANALINFVRHGGSLYGGSSGAVIMGRNIATVLDDKKDYRHETGLKLLNNYSILCHYDKTQENRIERYILKYGFPVIALPENSGLIVERDVARVVGYNSITIFDLKFNKTFLLPEDSFNIKTK